jgi:hypothetical protein
MTTKLLLESTTCGRCGGSGRFSFNLMHGSICYGCKGRGEVLTKRGQAAQNWMNEQRMVAAEDFKPGDLLYADGFSAGSYSQPSVWARVQEVQQISGAEAGYVNQPELRCVRIVTDKGKFIGFAGGTRYRRGQSAEAKAALRAAALAYQATLTKLGKPSKRAMAAAA